MDFCRVAELRLFHRMRLREVDVVLRHLHELLVMMMQDSQLGFRQVFDVNQAVAGALL